MIPEFARFLTAASLSTSQSAFTELRVQAVDPTEIPAAEWDLRGQGYGPPEVAALAAQHLNPDTAYFVGANWDLWFFDLETLKWRREPQPLTLVCHGPLYDDGVAATAGHFAAERQLEGISRQDPRKHPTIGQLGGGHRGCASSRAQRTILRGRRKFRGPAGRHPRPALILGLGGRQTLPHQKSNLNRGFLPWRTRNG